jgi:phospholipase C
MTTDDKISSGRRNFLRASGSAITASAALSMLPASIRAALAVPAATVTGTIQDVQHIVILMQENRAFDHYFGTLRGVRGFGDRFPIPLQSGKPVWFQSDGTREIPPYHLDSTKVNALLVPDTPHSYSDMQAAWNQGKYGFWPKYKTQFSMGHYERADIPFQFALAEAFTICDAYHCSITTGTDPNRIVFWSGSNFNPALRAQGINCTAADSEPNNLRCWVRGSLPTPGYTYDLIAPNTPFTWPTLPDVLEQAGISWRIYQNPNDNWTGAMHGCLAFASFRNALPGSSIYLNGMTNWSIADLKTAIMTDTLPQVSWVLPSQANSEHPGGPSSPTHGGNFTSQVLDALTANPAVWSKTVLFVTFDENDGFFDHAPAPALPSYNADGSVAGMSTLPLAGEYFSDPTRAALRSDDTISGTTRPWGMGPRVPMYVVSPWSKGGWVNSQVFDHTSVGMFLEKRFGITIPAISPWHRAVSGDLTSAFDFESPNDPTFPPLPDQSNWSNSDTAQKRLPSPVPPTTPQPLFQEPGVRYSRALPYALGIQATVDGSGSINLTFSNTGDQGAVLHVYDRKHLDRIPRRYTVESGKSLADAWNALAQDAGDYDLWVLGPNNFHRSFVGNVNAVRSAGTPNPEFVASASDNGNVTMTFRNTGTAAATFQIAANAYFQPGSFRAMVGPGQTVSKTWNLAASGGWYDFSATVAELPGYTRRVAGRIESGRDSVSDPAAGL